MRRVPRDRASSRFVLASIVVLTGLTTMASCIPSNVVAEKHRAVAIQDFEVEVEGKPWQATTTATIVGMWRSFRIVGDVAASLAEVTYSFGSDGDYSGAALSHGSLLPTFEVLQGKWRVDETGLVLDDEGVASRIRDDVLELAAEGGAVYLRRFTIQ